MRTQKLNHPTGFAPQALPLYEELDAGGFEQFCTDLLNLHPVVLCLRGGRTVSRRILEATRLLSGRPQKGADIRAEADQGEVWFFQCKRTQSFTRSKVLKAIELAEEALPQADQFVLVTTCGLEEDAQREIHSRAKWLWWDTSRLTTEVSKIRPRENGISLIHRYFGPAVRKRLFTCSELPLLTWQEFFAQDLSTERAYFHHREAFVPWGDALTRLVAFAHTGSGRALILTAPGGQGKSRLLLELSRRLETQPGAPRARFLNLNHAGLTAEQKDFLTREEGDLLLIVDDAHRLDGAIEDIARATTDVKSVRLLLATRPQALEVVRSQLYKHGYAERLEEPLSLPRWKPPEILKLAEQVLEPHAQIHVSRLIGLTDRCPLLVILGGALVNSGRWPDAIKDEEAFRERVFHSFKQDFLNRQPETRRERLDRLMSFVTFISPTPKNESLLDKAGEVLSCSPLDVAEDLDLLHEAGLLVENREGIRLYPDLFADAVLLDAALDRKGNASVLCQAVLKKLPIGDFPALMRNLAQADWEARTRKGTTHSLFDPIWGAFIERFRRAEWANHDADLSNYFSGDCSGSNNREPTREDLLGQWAAFAVFLPERTLDLADLALELGESRSPERESNDDCRRIRASLSSNLPGLLKPIAIWHHKHARRALEILWSLDAEMPMRNFTDDSNAVAAIAESASFEIDKPLSTSRLILQWLEEKLRTPAAIDRLHRQPWLLSALLKPFFGRIVEHNWWTSRTLHLERIPVPVVETRPLRETALRIVEKFLTSAKIDLAYAVIPLIQEAISHSFPGRDTDNERWRSDRLDVCRLVERSLHANRTYPILLFKLRRILGSQYMCDADDIVREECRRVLAKCPDTFELRVVRALSSWAHDEISVRPEADYKSELAMAETQWLEYRRMVAKQVVDRFGTAQEIIRFIGQQVRNLAEAQSSTQSGALLDTVIEVSPDLSTSLLKELLATADQTLDSFLWPVIQQTSIHAIEAYQEALCYLASHGRPQQVSALIYYMGWKQLHGGGLSAEERQTLLTLTERNEEPIISSLASVAGGHSLKEVDLALDVLLRLKPVTERASRDILQALSRLIENNSKAVRADQVRGVLSNVGEFCLPESSYDESHLKIVAKAFPKQVYEQILSLLKSAQGNPAGKCWYVTEDIPLGPIDDSAFLDTEIERLWRETSVPEPNTLRRRFHISLIRSLLRADPITGQERLRDLVTGCTNGEQIKLVAEILATPGSSFVFTFPDIVRMILNQAKKLEARAEVERVLWISACGGGRSFTENELDPEYRYILELGEANANRFQNDSVLGPFYSSIVKSERATIEWNRKAFRDDEEE